MALFKFKSTENLKAFNRDIKTFYNNQIWFSGLESLNDPFEKVYSSNVFNTRINNKELVEKLFLPFKNNVDVFYKKVGILSLCNNAKNLVMWSHYANNYKGYCVEYILNENVLNRLNFSDQSEIFLFPIEYEETPIDFLTFPSKLQFFLRRKSKLWSYENEFRFISPKTGLHNIPENAIKAIYLCVFIDESIENILKTLCLNKNIELYKTVLSKNSYELFFERIF